MPHRVSVRAVLPLVASLVLFNVCHAADTAPIRIGQEEQMFLDNHVIERTENITRRVNHATKHGPPLIRRDRPWERGRLYLFGTVLYDRDEKLFKMWHYSDGDVAYCVSKDGIAWEKPELDIVLRNGQKTNLVMERAKKRGERGPFGYIYEIFNVLKDENDPDPKRRYKMAFLGIDFNYSGEHMDPYHRSQRRALGTAISPDGIHWTLENEWASHDICDGMTCVFWDDMKKRYVAFGRTKLTPDKNDGRWVVHGWGRAVNRIESEDFRSWSKGELVFATDAKDPKGSEIYSLSVVPYEGVYVGFVQMYYALPDQGNLEIQLAVSRDGKNFTRVEPRDAFLGEGDVGDWDRFNISLGMPPVEVGDELWFYYSGRTYRHPPYKGPDTGAKGGCIGLARIKRGRFLSLEASFDGGTILTKPILIEGTQLFVNANATYGSIDIELLDEKEAPIPGGKVTIRGVNEIAAPAPLRAGLLEKQKGKSIRLRFTLKNAQLYGFRLR